MGLPDPLFGSCRLQKGCGRGCWVLPLSSYPSVLFIDSVMYEKYIFGLLFSGTELTKPGNFLSDESDKDVFVMLMRWLLNWLRLGELVVRRIDNEIRGLEFGLLPHRLLPSAPKHPTCREGRAAGGWFSFHWSVISSIMLMRWSFPKTQNAWIMSLQVGKQVDSQKWCICKQHESNWPFPHPLPHASLHLAIPESFYINQQSSE